MFGAAGYAAARSRYRDVDVGARVAGASPHGLVALLFEELGGTLETMAAGLAAGAGPFRGGMPERRARAMSILAALEGSLDHAAGGALAARLAAIYREARRLLTEALAANDPEPIVRARRLIGDIAEAWAVIRS